MIMEAKLLIDISKLNSDGAFKAVVQIIYLKQKYDSTCLDIVLKQLVNEHFEW